MRETANQIIGRALELRRREARARQLADLAVALAMDERGGEPTRNPRAYAHDVALLATTILIDQIYREDAELAALRQELELYRERALDLANLAPVRLLIPKPEQEDGQ
jgi:hypothetical protein